MRRRSLLQYVRSLGKDRPATNGAGLKYGRACNLEDFGRPEVRELVRSIFLHDQLRFGDDFPAGREDRRYWQAALTARTFADHGVLAPRSEVLGVGAGNEPVVFWLTNKVRRVFATDLYLREGSRAHAHCGSMPAEPGRHWPGSWNHRRLVVQHMSPRDLSYSDESFDGVLAPHALDACRSPDEVERTLEEMYRVLRPGGVLSLIVGLRLEGSGTETAGRRLFGESEVRDGIVGALDWVPLGGLDLAVSEATRATEQPAEAVEAQLREHLARHGQVLPHELTWGRYPHLAIRDGDTLSVPAHLALRKPGRRS
jgi:SAM-dependent methyltransferase